MSNEFVIKKGLLVQGGQNQITGSLTVSGSISATAITASFYGTASYTISSSWAPGSSLTSSQAISSSYVANAQNASSLSSLFIGKLNGDEYTITDLAESPEIRFIYNSAADTYYFGQGTQVITNPTISSSYARTASYAMNGGTGGGGSLGTGSTYPFTSSQSITASYALNTEGLKNFSIAMAIAL